MIAPGSRPQVWLRSAPAENTRSPPVKITHGALRTSGASSASHSSRSISEEMAFSLAGRRSLTTQACSWRSMVRTSGTDRLPVRDRRAELQQLVQAAFAGLVGDDQALDLGGAFPDPVHADVAVQPL